MPRGAAGVGAGVNRLLVQEIQKGRNTRKVTQPTQRWERHDLHVSKAHKMSAHTPRHELSGQPGWVLGSY